MKGEAASGGSGTGTGQAGRGGSKAGRVVLVFTPSAMPAGKQLFIG